MKAVDLIASFELEINKLNDSLNKPVTDDSLYWINQGVVKFTKQRFNGSLPRNTSYEQTEKRTSDLINLLKETDVTYTTFANANPSYDEYVYEYPNDMMYVLNEDVIISD